MAKQPSFDASMRMVILHGKEPFLTSRYSNDFLEILKSEYGDTDRVTFDGSTVALATVLDELRTFDLLMRHKLVIVDNADTFVAAKENASTPPRKALERYAEQPVEQATLLLRANTWRVGKLDKAVSKVGLVYKIHPLNEMDSVRWCLGRCKKEYGCDLDSKTAHLLVRRIGLSLTSLDTELSKLASRVSPATNIQYEDVIEMVGLSREEQAWEIQSVILSGNPKVSLTKLSELLLVSRQPKELLMWSVVDLTRRLSAASDMLQNGATNGEVRKMLKLFGEGGDRMISMAKRTKPQALATLFTDAVAIDARTRSGTLGGQHGLEMLTLRICDVIS